MKRISVICKVVMMIIPAITFAQQLGLSTEQITLDVRPQIVQPNRMVTINVISYSTDIDRAQVSLYVDGKLLDQGLGLKQLSVLAPSVGEEKEVRVVIKTIDRGTVSKTLNLAPSQVDLLYEATNSLVPVMYEGKRLPAHEGGVKVVAIPYLVGKDGRKLDAGSLIYTWKVDDVVQQDASGYGRDVFRFQGSPYYRIRTVSVQVESVDQTMIADRTIEIPAFDPVARFYVEHPLWGTDLSQAVIAEGPLLLNVPEMKVRSVPFYISDSDSLGLVDYEWRMNGQEMTTFGDRNIINLRAPEEGEGRAQIDLKITHNQKILQIAQSVFTVVFGEEAVRRARESSGSNSSPNFFGTGN